MVRRMVGEPKASEPIVDILRPEIRLGHPQAAPDPFVGGWDTSRKKHNDCMERLRVPLFRK